MLPPLYPENHDIDKRDLLDDPLKKDIAWSLAEGIDEYTKSQPETFLVHGRVLKRILLI